MERGFKGLEGTYEDSWRMSERFQAAAVTLFASFLFCFYLNRRLPFTGNPHQRPRMIPANCKTILGLGSLAATLRVVVEYLHISAFKLCSVVLWAHCQGFVDEEISYGRQDA